MELNTKINDRVIVHSFLWKLSERFVSQGVSILIQIFLARILFPNDFGALALIVAFINFASIFVQAGLSTAIVQKKDLSIDDVATAFTSSLGIASILYFVLFLSAPFIAQYYNNEILCNALKVLSLILFLNAINAVQSAILIRRMDFKIIFYRSILAVPTSGLIGILMAYYGYGLWALVMYNLVNILITVLVMSIGTDIKIVFGFNRSSFIQIYNFSGKIILSNLVSGVYDFVRTALIGKKFNASELAYFDKANTYSFYLVSIINTSISSVLLPAFSRSQDKVEDLLNMARRSMKVTTFVMIPVFVGVISMADMLVKLILTDKWIGCVPYLIIFCLLRIPGCMINIDRQVYYALGRSDIVLYYESGLLFLNLIAIYTLMSYGVLWIVIGACVVEYIGLIFISLVSSKLYKYSLYNRIKDISKTMFASGIMYLLISYTKSILGYDLYTLPIQVLIGLLSYVLISYVLKNDSVLFIINRIIKNRDRHLGGDIK